MKIRQIDIGEALELSKTNKIVYVIPNPEKPVVKQFNKLSVGDVMSENSEYIFFVLEEG